MKNRFKMSAKCVLNWEAISFSVEIQLNIKITDFFSQFLFIGIQICFGFIIASEKSE